ncbi:serine/threonine-protein kinase atr-like isoform X2 [Tachypleus tridentatus]|uniref:serine/threonine-protein kinase atr-like isoform X2 n=1 Tax=Tachypleus tridentatus TaxID=6853 RepID=UPI003FD11C7E
MKQLVCKSQLQDAFSCYERAVKVKPDTISHHQGLLRCLMGLDQSNTALTYATGLVNERPEWSNEINPFHVESAWKLADWDGLSEFLKSISSDNWGVAVGKILLSVKEKLVSGTWQQISITNKQHTVLLFQENEKILEHLKIVRTQQMGPLSAASMENGAYQRGCSHVLRLHMLTDMEKAVQVFTGLCPSFQGSYSSVSRLNSTLRRVERKKKIGSILTSLSGTSS